MPQAIVLNLPDEDRQRARRLALQAGCSEDHIYVDLIREGLRALEGIDYLNHLRRLSRTVSREEALSILDRAPDVEPVETDRI